MENHLKIKRLREEAILPRRATEGSAGYDLHSCMTATIAPGETVKIPTGLAVELHTGTVGLVFARSSMAVKFGVLPANAVGVIDSDYRGEIIVGLHNQSKEPYTVQTGDRIAQLVIVPIMTPQIEEVDQLEDTSRGAGGFGSTGKA